MTRIGVLSSGHGGPYTGAISTDGVPEAVRNWRLTERVQYHLQPYDVEVVLTHVGAHTCMTAEGEFADPNERLEADLHRRPQVANDRNADLFLPLHHNAIGDETQRAATLWVWTNKRAADGDLVWLRAVGNHNDARSYAKALKMEEPYKQALAEVGIPYGGIMCADFQELRDCVGDGILIENGFCTNPENVAILNDPAKLDRLARGIADGIVAALQLREKPKPIPENAVTVLVNGVEVQDCDGTLEDETTRVNLRQVAVAIADALGYVAEIAWDQKSKTANVKLAVKPRSGGGGGFPARSIV